MGNEEPTPSELTLREQRFVEALLVTLDATKAALIAGYCPSGNRASAGTIGYKLKKKPHIKAAIERAQLVRLERIRFDQDKVLSETARAGFFDVADVFDAKGRLLPIAKVPEDTRRAISSIKVKSHFEGNGEDAVEVWTTEIKFVDRLKALELLCRHLGILKDKLEVEAGTTLEQLVAASLRKAVDP